MGRRDQQQAKGPRIVEVLRNLAFALTAGLAASRAESGPNAAVEVVAIRPDLQLRAVLELFEGAPWPHPAAALADWKRAAGPGEVRSIGKPLEALLAAFNPAMVRELAALDDARFALEIDGEGRARWSTILPSDDGTIEAIATAMALSEGGPEPSEGSYRVDRLGPIGAPLLADSRNGPTILASDRDALGRAIVRWRSGPTIDPSVERPGWVARVDPLELGRSDSRAARLLASTLPALGYQRRVEARVALSGATLSVALSGDAAPGGSPPQAIEPSWLDAIPIEEVAAAAALAVGPGPEGWGAVLEAASALERALPGRETAAPMGARLALLGLARGVRFDADLWPNLRGLTAWASTDVDRSLDAALLALHANDDEAALAIADRVVARLLATSAPAPVVADRPTPLGSVGGRPLAMAVRGPSVLLGWGDGALDAALGAAEDPDRSAGPMLRRAWDGAPPARLAALWPGRVPWAFGDALEDVAPILWTGEVGPDGPRDLIRWPDLDDAVRRVLEHVPARPETSPPRPVLGVSSRTRP